MFTQDTITLIVYRENRAGICEEVAFRATPKPTPTAVKKARLPSGKREVDTTSDTVGFYLQDVLRVELTSLLPMVPELKTDFA